MFVCRVLGGIVLILIVVALSTCIRTKRNMMVSQIKGWNTSSMNLCRLLNLKKWQLDMKHLLVKSWLITSDTSVYPEEHLRDLREIDLRHTMTLWRTWTLVCTEISIFFFSISIQLLLFSYRWSRCRWWRTSFLHRSHGKPSSTSGGRGRRVRSSDQSREWKSCGHDWSEQQFRDSFWPSPSTRSCSGSRSFLGRTDSCDNEW